MEGTHSLTSFSDDELLRRLSDLLGQSRRDEADLVGHIGEVDRRRLYAREASPSMFVYCIEVLHLSEAEAYLRIAAARASRKHPLLLTMLADGRLHLTAIAKLAPHLTLENREAVLNRASHRSKREIEELVAELSPRPDAPVVLRKLPDRRDGTTSPSLRLGLDAEVPSLHLRPEEGAAVARQLRPDGVGARESEWRPDGRRCTERQGLEFHHRHPFGRGGDHSVANVSLACRSHNGYLAEVDYGREAIAQHRRSETRRAEPTPSPSP